jgi:tripeptidyl-peptidase-1
MRFLPFATFALAAGVSIASPTSHNHVRHEKRMDSPQWRKQSRASPDMTLPVRIAIAQKDIHEGHDLLMEISDPKSEKYGQYLSAKEVGDMFRPSSESISYVRKWLQNSGIELDRHSVSAGRGWLKFDATAQELESLLLTEYHVYQHHETMEERIGCDEYHVPHAVQKHIEFITPAVYTAKVSRRRNERIMGRATPSEDQDGTGKLPWVGAPCHEVVKPECIRCMHVLS